MNKLFAAFRGVPAALLLATGVAAQDGVPPLSIKAIAEVESRSVEGGHVAVKLIQADRVVPGDRVLYTLEVRNTGETALEAPTVIHPVPDHMLYIAESAVGPGAEVSYSVDGAHSFGRADSLKV